MKCCWIYSAEWISSHLKCIFIITLICFFIPRTICMFFFVLQMPVGSGRCLLTAEPDSNRLIASEFLRWLMKCRGKTEPSAQCSHVCRAHCWPHDLKHIFFLLYCSWTELKPKVMMLHISASCLQCSNMHLEDLCLFVIKTGCLHTMWSAKYGTSMTHWKVKACPPYPAAKWAMQLESHLLN